MTQPHSSDPQALLPAFLIRGILLFLQALHWGIVGYSLLGWLPDSRFWLIVYLIWLPGLNIQWYFNNNSCIINNVESWLRSGQWRDESNPEEGAFIHTALTRLTGLTIPENAFDIFLRIVMAFLWIGAFFKLRGLA